MTIGFAYENGQSGIQYDQGAVPIETNKEIQGAVDVLTILTKYENVLKDLKQTLSHSYNVEAEGISANEKHTRGVGIAITWSSRFMASSESRATQCDQQHTLPMNWASSIEQHTTH